MDRIMLDHLINPWFDMISSVALSVFMLGVLLMWVHNRVNDAQIYNVAAYGCVVNGGILLLFGRNPFPHPLMIVLFFTSLVFSLGAFVSILTVLAVQRAPGLGFPETVVVDPDDHTPRLYLPFLITAAMLVLFWLSVSAPFTLLNDALGEGLCWTLALATVLVTSVMAYGLLPMTNVRETALLGETTPPKELDDIFLLTGTASVMERTTVPLVTLSFWGAGMYFATHGLDFGGDDWFGGIFLILLGGSIVMTEMSRARKTASFDSSPRRTARNL